MVWFAARRMRLLREYACDDAVLEGGALPSSYADELVKLARALQRERVCAAALGMAQRSQLYGRVCAILDPERARRSFTFGRAGLLAASLVLLLPAALLCPTASAEPASAISVAALTPLVPEGVPAPLGGDPSTPLRPAQEVGVRGQSELAGAQSAGVPSAPLAGTVGSPHGAHRSPRAVMPEAPSIEALLHRIESAGDAEALEALAEDPGLSQEGARQAYVARARTLGDDDQRALALQKLLYAAPISEETGRAVLAAAGAMSHDGARLTVLEAFHCIRESDLVRGALATEYLDVAAKLGPDALGRALTDLLHPRQVPRATVLRALELAQRVDAPERRLEVLQEVTDHQWVDATVEAAFRGVVAGLPECRREEPLQNLKERKSADLRALQSLNQRRSADLRAWAMSIVTKDNDGDVQRQRAAVKSLFAALEKGQVRVDRLTAGGLREKLKAKEVKLREKARALHDKGQDAIDRAADHLEHVADQLEEQIEQLDDAAEEAREKGDSGQDD
jgi:hypothetical protein